MPGITGAGLNHGVIKQIHDPFHHRLFQHDHGFEIAVYRLGRGVELLGDAAGRKTVPAMLANDLDGGLDDFFFIELELGGHMSLSGKSD